MAWVKEEARDNEASSWLLFDDDKVSRVGDDDIRKLTGAGGSDWHLAYMLLYRAKRRVDHEREWARLDAAKANAAKK